MSYGRSAAQNMLYLIDKEFESLLKARFDSDMQTNNLLYGIWSDGRLAYANPAWFEFAEKNNGRSILES